MRQTGRCWTACCLRDKVDLLQKAIAGNAALKAALDKERVEPSAIVATRLEADGSLTVFLPLGRFSVSSNC